MAWIRRLFRSAPITSPYTPGIPISPEVNPWMFINRSEDETTIRSRLEQGWKSICITGNQGIGKTSLAARIAHTLSRQWLIIPCLFDHLPQYTQKAFMKHMYESLAATGVSLPRQGWFQGLGWLTDALETVLSVHESSIAIIWIDGLDRLSNFPPAAQRDIGALIKGWHDRNFSNARFLLTTISPFVNTPPPWSEAVIASQMYQIHPLSVQDSCQLLTFPLRNQRVSFHQEAAMWLAQQSGGNPTVLHAIGDALVAYLNETGTRTVTMKTAHIVWSRL